MDTIETTRLLLRPFREDDGSDLQELAVDWKAATGPEWDKLPTDEESAKGMAMHFAGDADRYVAMCFRSDGKVVGLLAVNGVEDNGSMDLGHIILSKHQDDDLDREALGAIVEHIFADSKIPSIVAHNADHPPQLAPLRSLGFTGEKGESLVLSRDDWDAGRR